MSEEQIKDQITRLKKLIVGLEKQIDKARKEEKEVKDINSKLRKLIGKK